MKCSQVLPDMRVSNWPELAAMFKFSGVADPGRPSRGKQTLVQRMTAVCFSGKRPPELGLGRKVLVADELRGRAGFDLRERNDLLLLCARGAGALLSIKLFKPFLSRSSRRRAPSLREIEREA